MKRHLPHHRGRQSDIPPPKHLHPQRRIRWRKKSNHLPLIQPISLLMPHLRKPGYRYRCPDQTHFPRQNRNDQCNGSDNKRNSHCSPPGCVVAPRSLIIHIGIRLLANTNLSDVCSSTLARRSFSSVPSPAGASVHSHVIRSGRPPSTSSTTRTFAAHSTCRRNSAKVPLLPKLCKPKYFIP